jgi:hypothetical protein
VRPASEVMPWASASSGKNSCMAFIIWFQTGRDPSPRTMIMLDSLLIKLVLCPIAVCSEVMI